MLKTCIALTTALTSLVVAPVALSQSALTNKDIQYLASLNQLLLGDKDHDLSRIVERIPNEQKIEAGKGICRYLRSGDNFRQLSMALYSNEIRQVAPDINNLTESQIDVFRSYVFTAWYAGVQNYCPEYNYQLESN
jgi:hypothetical protein